MIEKKCVNCENMSFCAMYQGLINMAGLLNHHLEKSIDEKTGFLNMADTMAHDCKRFSAFKEGA